MISTTSATGVSRKRIDLLEKLLEQALEAGERYLMTFSQLAALARSMEGPDVCDLDQPRLLSLLESVATDAEANARLDVELLEGLLAGRFITRDEPSTKSLSIVDGSSSSLH